MAAQYPKPTVLDATVVSNFASTNSIGYLIEVLDSPVVTPAVRDEITEGYREGYDYLETAVDAFDDELPIIDVDQRAEFSEIRNRLDAGESESLLGALQHNGTLATDDMAARRIADDRNRPIVGSIGLLVLSVERGRLDKETADSWLDAWRNDRGYYAPVESVTDVLED